MAALGEELGTSLAFVLTCTSLFLMDGAKFFDAPNIEIKTQQQQTSTINKNEEKMNKPINNEQNIYKLKAILDFNQEKVALFSINDKIYRVRQGDMVNDIKILVIGQNNLILQESTGKEVKCPLT